MRLRDLALWDPQTGARLVQDSPHSVAGGGSRFPVVAGIPFLRRGRDALRRRALAALDNGDAAAACSVLLADQDDHASAPPPDPDDLQALAVGHVPTLREAMARLGLGPVAGYFAHRLSAPTFVSALGLLAEYWRPDMPLVDVACGIGQILREARASGATVVGIDIVFAKLWLARRYVLGPETPLICADAEAGPPVSLDTPACVLCHDALYFMADKRTALASMRAMATRQGALLIGHAHNRLVDQRGVGGRPLSPDEWAALLPDAAVLDDAECARAWLDGRRATGSPMAALARAEAVSLVVGRRNAIPEAVGVARPGRPLRLNPLLKPAGADALTARWPTAALAAEYADMSHLHHVARPTADTLADAAAGRLTAEIARLARRRVLVDLPEAW